MAKKKVYAVKKGKQTGLFYSWNECKESVSGYPGAEYKGFETEEEAKNYLENRIQEIKKVDIEENTTNQLVVYVDGSFDEKIGKYAFGCIILTPRGETIRESGNGNEPDSLAIRNVAGEMLGAMYAVQWAIKNGYHNLELRYDYEGIEKWAQGEWKAKNTLTQKYANFMKSKSDILKISYQKVKAHSGDHYNEEADKLAKAALTEGNGIPKVKRGDFWFTVEGISDEGICKGKKEIENRNSPQRAAVYLDIPIPCAGLLYYEKEKSLHYCEQQTYHVVTILEGVGCGNSIEKENWQRLAVLAGKGMIDVIVVSGLSRLSYCPEEILQTMELLQAFQVQIDCIGYGILDYARLKQYLMHTWEKQEQFEQDLDAYLCSCCTREGI